MILLFLRLRSRANFVGLPVRSELPMKVGLVASAMALLAATTAVAFVPPNAPLCRRARSASPNSSPSALAASLPKVSFTNPYKNLPWNVEREEQREQRRLVIENAALFRELGLPQDATYEDVDGVTKHLIAMTEGMPKNEGIKKRIKIEIARDKIYQIRLNERITGVRNEQIEAAVADKWDEGGVEALQELTDSVDDIVKPKRKLRIPIVSGLIEYAQSIYTPPDPAWRKRMITIWGGSTVALLILPGLIEQVFTLTWFFAGGIMGFRGMPVPEGNGTYNPFKGKRNKKSQFQAMAIALPIWVMARGLAFDAITIARFPSMSVRTEEFFRFAAVQFALGMACSFLQTYKGEENNPTWL